MRLKILLAVSLAVGPTLVLAAPVPKWPCAVCVCVDWQSFAIKDGNSYTYYDTWFELEDNTLYPVWSAAPGPGAPQVPCKSTCTAGTHYFPNGEDARILVYEYPSGELYCKNPGATCMYVHASVAGQGTYLTSWLYYKCHIEDDPIPE